MDIFQIAKAAGMETDCMNMGAASCVYTEGCGGVAQDQLEAFAVAVAAAERERVRAAIEAFPHWLGPQAKKELLAALYGPNAKAHRPAGSGAATG